MQSMIVIKITVIHSTDYDQITMGIWTRWIIVIITTDIFAVYAYNVLICLFSAYIYESSQKLTLNIILKSWFASSNILFVTSIHQATNFVSHNFFYEFFSVWGNEKENKLFVGPNVRVKNWGKQDRWFGGLISRTRYKRKKTTITRLFKKTNKRDATKLCTSVLGFTFQQIEERQKHISSS